MYLENILPIQIRLLRRTDILVGRKKTPGYVVVPLSSQTLDILSPYAASLFNGVVSIRSNPVFVQCCSWKKARLQDLVLLWT